LLIIILTSNDTISFQFQLMERS